MNTKERIRGRKKKHKSIEAIKFVAMAKWSVVGCALKVVCIAMHTEFMHFCYSSHINGPNSMNWLNPDHVTAINVNCKSNNISR